MYRLKLHKRRHFNWRKYTAYRRVGTKKSFSQLIIAYSWTSFHWHTYIIYLLLHLRYLLREAAKVVGIWESARSFRGIPSKTIDKVLSKVILLTLFQKTKRFWPASQKGTKTALNAWLTVVWEARPRRWKLPTITFSTFKTKEKNNCQPEYKDASSESKYLSENQSSRSPHVCASPFNRESFSIFVLET